MLGHCRLTEIAVPVRFARVLQDFQFGVYLKGKVLCLTLAMLVGGTTPLITQKTVVNDLKKGSLEIQQKAYLFFK